MTNTCGKKHPGRCATTALFPRAMAEAALRTDGFQFNAERGDWENDKGQRGRLAWYPSYCDPTSGEGTRFFLRRPNEQAHEGDIIVLEEVPA